MCFIKILEDKGYSASIHELSHWGRQKNQYTDSVMVLKCKVCRLLIFQV